MMITIMAVKTMKISHWYLTVEYYLLLISTPSSFYCNGVLVMGFAYLETRDKRIQLRDASIFLPPHSELYLDLKSAILAVAA